MAKQDDGGPAFPTPDYNKGMSLRDWFAGQALVGLLAGARHGLSPAEVAYKFADAMLAARKPSQ